MIQTISDILFWIYVPLYAWVAYYVLFNRGVPNIRTAPAVRRRIIDRLKQDRAEKSNQTPYIVYDLGSGNGLFTREIARAMPDARVIGVETAPFSIWWANKMKKALNIRNVEYVAGDFFKTDISNADAVVLYQSVYLMERLGNWFREILKPGTLITTTRFHLPPKTGWEPIEIIEPQTLDPLQKEVRVYRKK